jgi:hypothetical protein
MEGARPTITVERRWAVGVAIATFAIIAGLILALVLVAADDDGWDHPDFGPEMMAPGSWPGGMPHGYGYGPGDMPHGDGYGYGPGSGEPGGAMPPRSGQGGGPGSSN